MTCKLTERQVTRLRKDFEKKRNRSQVKEWLKARRQEKGARRSRPSRLNVTAMDLPDESLDDASDGEEYQDE